MYELKKSQIIRNSLFNEDSLSISTDVLENRVGIEILDKIPLVSYAASLLKIADYARDRWLLRKIARFIKSTSQNQLSEEDRAKAQQDGLDQDDAHIGADLILHENQRKQAADRRQGAGQDLRNGF